MSKSALSRAGFHTCPFGLHVASGFSPTFPTGALGSIVSDEGFVSLIPTTKPIHRALFAARVIMVEAESRADVHQTVIQFARSKCLTLQ